MHRWGRDSPAVAAEGPGCWGTGGAAVWEPVQKQNKQQMRRGDHSLYLLVYSSAVPAPQPPPRNTAVADCCGICGGSCGRMQAEQRRSWGQRFLQGMREQSRVLGQGWGGGMASKVPGCPRGSLCPHPSRALGVLSPAGAVPAPLCHWGERTVVAEHPCDLGGRLLISGGARPAASIAAAGWGPNLLSQRGRW